MELFKQRHRATEDSNTKLRNKSTYIVPTNLWQWHNGEREISSINSAGKNGYSYKNEIGLLYDTQRQTANGLKA